MLPHGKGPGQGSGPGFPRAFLWTDRLSHAVIVACIQADVFLNENRFTVEGWALHPRAAPVPLYLKNTSFIC